MLNLTTIIDQGVMIRIYDHGPFDPACYRFVYGIMAYGSIYHPIRLAN